MVMVGNAGEGTQDFSAVKLDEDGGFLWEVQVMDETGRVLRDFVHGFFPRVSVVCSSSFGDACE